MKQTAIWENNAPNSSIAQDSVWDIWIKSFDRLRMNGN